MSQHDLVSAQTSNVCITHHAALNAIAYIVCVKQVFCDVTSSNFLGSVGAEMVGEGEVGWYIHPKGENSMAVFGFGCINPSVGSLHKWSWKTVISPHRASMQCSSAIY